MRPILHAAIEKPRAHLQHALDRHRPGHMVFLIGPSGVGKTTIRRHVMREVYGRPCSWGLGLLPAIETFALLPQNAYYSSRALASSLLEELHEPKFIWLQDLGNQGRVAIPPGEAIWSSFRSRNITEASLWAALERSLSARSCKLISIDQATTLLVNRKDKSPSDHVLHLMALAEKSGCMFLMTGVHSATKLWAIHSELRRRVDVIWVPPYLLKNRGDRAAFERLLITLTQADAAFDQSMLIGMSDEVMAATGGIIGEVVELLRRSRRLAGSDGRSRVCAADIRSATYGDDDLKTLWRDIDSFLQAMRSGDAHDFVMNVRRAWT